MTVDNACEDVGQIRERVDVVQLASLDQGRDGGSMLGASVGVLRATTARERRSGDGFFGIGPFGACRRKGVVVRTMGETDA
jgi:hypothetical protein